MTSVKRLHQDIKWLERYLEYYNEKYPSHFRYIERITISLNKKKEALTRLS